MSHLRRQEDKKPLYLRQIGNNEPTTEPKRQEGGEPVMFLEER
jgi:hypothetical protein